MQRARVFVYIYIYIQTCIRMFIIEHRIHGNTCIALLIQFCIFVYYTRVYDENNTIIQPGTHCMVVSENRGP